jgi:hypothetical protein
MGTVEARTLQPPSRLARRRMKPLFPPWTNTVVRLALATALGTILVVPVALIAWARTPYSTVQYDAVEQPVQFDHRHHVRDDGIDCLYCHEDAMRGPFAGVPATATCMSCHSQVWNESEKLRPVRESWFSKTPIEWVRITALPEHVYFDHSAHTSHGVGCVECHGQVDRMATPYPVHDLNMGFCLRCHRDPAPHLRPQDRITDMDWQPSPGTGEAIAKELHVEPTTSCSGCHR